MENHFDVVIIGAGLSGIGGACHIKENCPNKTFTILEGRDTLGGTWDLFRYPGIRSDSDMFTLGYSFKPWLGNKALANGDEILTYVTEAADEFNVTDHIQYNSRVERISWSTENNVFTLTIKDAKTGAHRQMTAQFVWSCTGYYDYEKGYQPDFEGLDDFKGKFIHPQFWPKDYDYSGKKVVVIGSGATAVTVVPAMTDKAEHVTMLQRSPTYIAPIPAENKVNTWLRKYFSEMRAYEITRWFNISFSMFSYWYCKTFPNSAKKLFTSMAEKGLKDKVDVSHFTPSYNPWDQRVCAIPDGDLYKVLRRGKASVVTDHIDRIVEDGILLKSGKKLEADVIVSATGLKLLPFGGIKGDRDGQEIDYSELMSYKGMMLEGVPNMLGTTGYTNSSWTLKADLVAEYFCRVLNYMDENGYTIFVAQNDEPMEKEPAIDFASGYVQRDIHRFPKQGSKFPWKLYQNYFRDFFIMKKGKIKDGILRFEKKPITHEISKSAMVTEDV